MHCLNCKHVLSCHAIFPYSTVVWHQRAPSSRQSSEIHKPSRSRLQGMSDCHRAGAHSMCVNCDRTVRGGFVERLWMWYLKGIGRPWGEQSHSSATMVLSPLKPEGHRGETEEMKQIHIYVLFDSILQKRRQRQRKEFHFTIAYVPHCTTVEIHCWNVFEP